ncbi:hypothetical protein FRC06_001410, partial [Ceratobasidium sp. 370]
MSDAPTVLDDNGISVVSVPQAVVAPRMTKRGCADSSPVAEHSRIIIAHKDTPFESDTPREMTPAGSEVGTFSSGASDLGSTMTGQQRRNKTKLQRLNADPESELAACVIRIRESKSDAYREFEDPVIRQRVGGPPTHYEFTCKHCGTSVMRMIGTAETSTLHAHIRKCASILREQELLNSYGITGGSNSRMTQEEVRKAVALWLASNARAFSQVQDSYFKRILHPDARKNLPHCTTIVQDIKQMYEVTQVEITKMLAEHRGAFHIALDLCQVGNGDDFLGIVIFRQVAPTGKPACIERFVLECL